MKKITYIITLIFFSIFLTGCVDVKINEEVTVNADKSIDHSISLLASDDASFAEDCIKEKFTEILKDKGFGNFVEQNEFDFFGIKGSAHMDMDKKNNSKLIIIILVIIVIFLAVFFYLIDVIFALFLKLFG